MHSDGADPHPVTDDPGDDADPAFSPSGKKITFVSNRDGGQEIYAMPADGGNVQRLTNNLTADSEPVWGARP